MNDTTSELCPCGNPLDETELDLMQLRTYADTEDICASCYDRMEKRQCDLESLMLN